MDIEGSNPILYKIVVQYVCPLEGNQAVAFPPISPANNFSMAALAFSWTSSIVAVASI